MEKVGSLSSLPKAAVVTLGSPWSWWQGAEHSRDAAGCHPWGHAMGDNHLHPRSSSCVLICAESRYRCRAEPSFWG